MNKQEPVNSWQMSNLFLVFMTGSAIINIPAPLTSAAKNGAWISLTLANAIGMFLLACILYLNRKYPGLTLIDYSRITLGKWLTIIFSIFYMVLLITMNSYIVIDIGGFLSTALMRHTPVYVFHSLILLVSAMTARAGIEVMARMFQPLLYLMILSVFIVIFLALPFYKVHFLLPILPQGIKPVLYGTYIAYGFPYSELIVFALLLPFVNEESKTSLGRFMFGAIIINGITLVLAIVCSIMAFGPLTGELKFSLLQVARLINVQEFVERIESVIGISLIAGAYMKSTIVLFALNTALSRLLKLKEERIFIFPLALVSFLYSLVMFRNEAEFNEEVMVVWPLMNFVMGTVPLLLIVLVTILKTTYLKSRNNG